MSLIKTINLSKIYRSNGVETTALHHINLEIRPAEMLAITGPSGCGKSSLLNLLGMIDRPSSGAYYFNGERVDGYKEREWSELRKNNIGFIFQNFNLVNDLSVFENVELPLLYTGLSKSERKMRVNHLLDQLKMTHRSRHFPKELSGGQQQRVAIARAISNTPKLILADEPTGNLDSRNGDEVMGLLQALNQAGTTVVLVTHAQHYANTCQRIIRLLDGKVITDQVNEETYV